MAADPSGECILPIDGSEAVPENVGALCLGACITCPNIIASQIAIDAERAAIHRLVRKYKLGVDPDDEDIRALRGSNSHLPDILIDVIMSRRQTIEDLERSQVAAAQACDRGPGQTTMVRNGSREGVVHYCRNPHLFEPVEHDTVDSGAVRNSPPDGSS